MSPELTKQQRRAAFWNGFIGFFYPPALKYSPHLFIQWRIAWRARRTKA